MADISIHVPSVTAVPSAYTVAGNQEIVLKGVNASFDGTGAAGSFIPAVQIVDPSGVVVGTYTANSTLAAGASADVAWFPGVTPPTSGSSSAGTVQVPIEFDTPDSTGNCAPALTTVNGFTNQRRILWYFVNGQDGTLGGTVRVPQNYSSTPQIVLSWVVNATTGNLRNNVSTFVAANNVSEDAAYTAESFVNTTVPGTARRRFDVTYSLSTTPAAGSDLNVLVERNGSNVGDTLAAAAALFQAVFQYTSH